MDEIIECPICLDEANEREKGLNFATCVQISVNTEHQVPYKLK